MSNKMKFSEALKSLEDGYMLSRTSWDNEKVFIFLVPGSTFNVNRPPLLGIFLEGTPIEYAPHIDICTSSGSITPWAVTCDAILASDWFVVGHTHQFRRG